MKQKTLLLILYCALVCCPALAISVPAAPGSPAGIGDTTYRVILKPLETPVKNKKVSFFRQLKNSLALLLVKKGLSKPGNGNTKETLGYVALGLFFLGACVFFLANPAVGLLFLLGALVTGIVGLAKKGNKTESVGKKGKRGKNTGLIVAILLSLAALGGLVIAISRMSWWH